MGVPSSAASYAAGQDLAPAALRSAGLLEQLAGSRLEVHDDGDLTHQVWSPDRDHPLVQNVDQGDGVAAAVGGLEPLLARGDLALVLGGNCTIVLAVMAALRRLGAGAPGLLYADRHYDINTPETTTDGALDWMGLAHALALPGCVDTVTDAFGPRPLLEAYQVAWLGVEPRVATDWEHQQAARLGLHVTTSEALAADPAGAARATLDHLPPGPLALTSTLTSSTSSTLLWRRIPTAATPDLPSTRPQRHSIWQREIRGCERCRSETSTRPDAPATLMRFPASLAASPASSPARFIRFACHRCGASKRAEQMKKYSTANARLMNGTLILILILAAFRSFLLGSECFQL